VGGDTQTAWREGASKTKVLLSTQDKKFVFETMAPSVIALTVLIALVGTPMTALADVQCTLPFGGEDNCETCLNEDPDPWCGGSSDPLQELTCTPFNYRPLRYNNEQGLDANCAIGDDLETSPFSVLAYDDSGAYPYPGARVWASQFSGDCDNGGGNTDYWVMHACDGAGVQGGDCKGDIKYVERFGTLWDGDRQDEGICTPDGEGFGYDNRKICKYIHPGTERVYSDYKAGWTGAQNNDEDTFWAKKSYPTAENSFQSAASGGWHDDSQLVQNLNDLPNWYNWDHPYAYTGYWFSFPMFLWRAARSDTSNNYLSYPTIAEEGWKVFADNEPCGDNGDDDCVGAPPEIDLILGGLTWDDLDGSGNDGPKIVFDMWRSDPEGNLKKLNDDVNNGDPFVLYPVHPGDGSCTPW